MDNVRFHDGGQVAFLLSMKYGFKTTVVICPGLLESRNAQRETRSVFESCEGVEIVKSGDKDLWIRWNGVMYFYSFFPKSAKYLWGLSGEDCNIIYDIDEEAMEPYTTPLLEMGSTYSKVRAIMATHKYPRYDFGICFPIHEEVSKFWYACYTEREIGGALCWYDAYDSMRNENERKKKMEEV